ncbi:uncharacterized protein LOC135489908 [Lineus longissimus]|uniref:uncharacterized protein LOC135489908 n=1 Tax=Lineus longissimus TaxID=88925 RepID=UPI00315D041E
MTLLSGNDVMCDFEEDLADCFMSNSREDTTDFVRADQCLGSTSPCYDHTSGYGYYLIFRPQVRNSYDRGTLVGPWLKFDSREICIGGYFHGAGSCSAHLIIQSFSSSDTDYHVSIPLTKAWGKEQLSFKTKGATFRVLIVAEVQNDSSASVSVDDLYIRSGSCDGGSGSGSGF